MLACAAGLGGLMAVLMRDQEASLSEVSLPGAWAEVSLSYTARGCKPAQRGNKLILKKQFLATLAQAFALL
jgi:hypothetical protein